MDNFRPEDKGRLGEKEAANEAAVLKTAAAMLVNHGIKEIMKKGPHYNPNQNFEEFGQYWDRLVEKYLGTIPKNKLSATFEYTQTMKETFFSFLVGAMASVQDKTIDVNIKFQHPDELKSKEIYDEACVLISQKRNIPKLIKLTLETWFTDKRLRDSIFAD